MTKEEIKNKLLSFDKQVELATNKRKEIPPDSPMWEKASKERYEILDELRQNVMEFLFKNGKLKDLSHGKELYPTAFHAALERVGDGSSYLDIYNWYCIYENMILSFIEVVPKSDEKIVLTSQKDVDISDKDIEYFDDKFKNNENINKAREELYEKLFSVSKIKDLPFGKNLHEKIVYWITKNISNELDCQEIKRLYSSYESIAIHALDVTELIDFKTV